MEVLAAMDRFEARFDIDNSVVWMRENWHISIYISATYLAVLYLGRRLMRDRPAYQLRRPLIMWNFCLAAFSFVCLCKLGVILIKRNYNDGLINFFCHARGNVNVTYVVLWGSVFAYSKVAELGDTAFIVLRKKPLTFLHYYHHVSVMVYCWFSLSRNLSATSHWFSTVNCLVHSVMYTYYTLTALGYRISPRVALSITILQISQMFVGIFANSLAYYSKYYHGYNALDCAPNDATIYWAFIMYASYVVLFVNFFVQRYISRKHTRPASGSTVIAPSSEGSVRNGKHFSDGALNGTHLKDD